MLVRRMDGFDLDGWMAGLLNRHPAVGLAVGLVRNGRLDQFAGSGLARIATQTPITRDTVFRVASITKTFTAIAAMQLWERGLVDLDTPANRYLKSIRLVPARPGHRDATLRDLLTHTSGIPEMIHVSRTLRYAFGESYALDERVPPPAEYYRGAIRLRSEPGKLFRYTDHNFAVVGQVVEDVSGERYVDYVREHVLRPLGMLDSDLERTERIAARLATGYTIGSRGPREVTDRAWMTTAASMLYSTPADMALYVGALLGGGANEHGRVLQPRTLALMFAPQYQPDPRIGGLGLAFDRFTPGGHAVIGHEGVLPGFNSQIFAAPDDGVGVIAFTNGAPGAMLWLPAEAMGLLCGALGVPADRIRADVPLHPELWSELCGWYPLRGPLTDMRLRVFLGAGARVFVSRGRLCAQVVGPVPALWRGFVLHPDDPDDPYAFRIDGSAFGIGTARIVFSRDAGATRMHLDLMPVSLERRTKARGASRRAALAE